MRALACCTLAAAAALQLSCASPDAEQELRALIDAAEAAAESRDTGHFRRIVSADYRDARGNGRDDVIVSGRCRRAQRSSPCR